MMKPIQRTFRESCVHFLQDFIGRLEVGKFAEVQRDEMAPWGDVFDLRSERMRRADKRLDAS
jgi:hypothetical protein